MPSQMKLGVFALISTAAAIPHGAHDRFHHRRQAGYGTGAPAPYPTGGWGFPHNSTAPFPTGTGTAAFPDSKTTTILDTQTSTETLVKTIYLTPSPVGSGGAAPSSVGAVDVSTGAAQCGPETVYVTATNKVTVTVPAGGAGGAPSSVYTPPSSAAEAASSVPVVPGGGYGTPSVSFSLPSSSAVEEQVSISSLPHKPVDTPAPQSSSEGIYSILPVTSAPVPVESSTPVYTPTPTPEASSVVQSSAPASSATPQPSGSPSYSGGKRGLAYNDASLCSAFGNGKFSFAYNWGQTESGSLPEGVKYVPMMHKPADSTPEKWLENVATAVKGGTDVVMGFNEPDHSAQANLSPEQACADWTNYMEPIVSAHPEVTILGPSVTNGPAPMGLDWLTRFQKACPDATWHGANIHFYDIYDDQTVERFKAQVEKAAESYGKPVWVTEFGLNPGSASPEQAATFLKGCMEYMDGSDKVKGYSYFMVGAGENQLNSGTGLSAVGEVYNS